MLRFGRPLARAAAFAGALGLTGCVEADKAGTPHLVSFDLIDATGAPIMRVPDAAVFTTSPRVTFMAVFDNVLDFSQIVNVDAGTTTPGLVTIAAVGNPVADAVYTPNGHNKFTLIYPKGPNITASPSPGLPSAASVTVALNTALLRGQNGQPLVVGAAPASISFQTDPFSVKGEDPEMMMPFSADHAFVVTASNIPNADFASKITVAGTVNMVPVVGLEYTVTVSEADPAQFLVAPKAGMWPAGSKITVTVAADAADQFGVALGMPATLSFDVAAPPAAP